MQKVTPCLWFDGQAEDAAKFYVSLLPNSEITKVVRSPADYPNGQVGSVLIVEFSIAGSNFIALNGGPEYPFTPAVSFSISCENQAEVDRLWAAILSAGGSEVQCGWIKDCYGLSWQIIPTRLAQLMNDPDPARAQGAMRAMMKMKKIDVAELERAAAELKF